MVREGSASSDSSERATTTQRVDNQDAVKPTPSRAQKEGTLKRVRAESVEPTNPENTPMTTGIKKNRLAPSTGQPPSKGFDVASGPNVDQNIDAEPESNDVRKSETIAEELDTEGNEKDEGRNVGEVRRKVEKMSYEEGAGEGEVQELEMPEKTGDEGPGSAMSISTRQPSEAGDIADDREGDWEKIDKSEAVGAEADDSAQKAEGSESLKRKALDRSTSSYVHEDDIQAKRSKEPPQTEDDAKSAAPDTVEALTNVDAAPKKPSAFNAFSSAASPFATSSSASPFASASTSAAPKASFASSGFGNYSSSVNIFAKKPAAPAEGSGQDVAKAGETSQGKSTSFGDILKQSTDDVDDGEEKVKMTEQDVTTGEEDEDTMYQTRSKLYVMQADGGWRERGVGTLKLNVRNADGKGARLVMRAEGVLRLILNVSLYVGMSCIEDGKHVRLAVFEDGERKFITLRTGSAKAAAELSDVIHEHIPLESSVPPKTPDASAATEEV